MAFLPEQYEALRGLGLDDAAIEALRDECDVAANFRRLQAASPGAADRRAEYVQAAADARSLAARLAGSGWARMGSVLVPPDDTVRLRELLNRLASGCDAKAANVVDRIPPASLAYAIRGIAAVVEPSGIRRSAATNSRFIRVVKICFEATGIFGSPTRHIRQFMLEG